MAESSPVRLSAVEACLEAVRAELHAAIGKFPPFSSPHEGYAIIKEELDELWDEVKADNGRGREAHREALQVAAMGLRYLVDLGREQGR